MCARRNNSKTHRQSLQLFLIGLVWLPNTWTWNIWLFRCFFMRFSNSLFTGLGGSFENGTFFVQFSDHHSKTRPFDIIQIPEFPGIQILTVFVFFAQVTLIYFTTRAVFEISWLFLPSHVTQSSRDWRSDLRKTPTRCGPYLQVNTRFEYSGDLNSEHLNNELSLVGYSDAR